MSRSSGQRTEDTGAALRRTLRDFIARRVGDPDTADDLTQEVLLKVHRARAMPGEIDDTAAWLYRIARNTLIDHYRSRGRHPVPEALSFDLVAGDPDDAEQAIGALAGCMRPLVAELDPIYRDAVTLTDLDGLTQTEAARRAGISVSGMKSRVQRARAQLKAAVLECCALSTDAAGRISDYDAPPGCCS